MTLRILSGNGAVQIMPFRKLGGKCHFFLRFCTRKRSETYGNQKHNVVKWPVRLNKLAEARTIRGFKLIFAALFQYS